MKYSDFEEIVSYERLNRYLEACNGDRRKAMALYRYNIDISASMLKIVSCFEVAIRNAIDKHLRQTLGSDWLRDSVLEGGVFSSSILQKTRSIIIYSYNRLVRNSNYSHSKLLAEMEFGIWKYMFSPVQYRQSGRDLLKIFPNKPRSTREKQYNQATIFNELDRINSLRNRIAHHEPICFINGTTEYNTTYIKASYQNIITLFDWLGIDSKSYLYGLDNVKDGIKKIDSL